LGSAGGVLYSGNLSFLQSRQNQGGRSLGISALNDETWSFFLPCPWNRSPEGLVRTVLSVHGRAQHGPGAWVRSGSSWLARPNFPRTLEVDVIAAGRLGRAGWNSG